MIYFVIQPESRTLWGTFEGEKPLFEFLQYMMDSAITELLKPFVVVDSNGREAKLLDVCKKNGIRKRSFEERLKAGD